jgi:hypothetical protein
VTGGPQVEWVAGFPRRWWSAGFLAILWGSVAVGVVGAYVLGYGPMSMWGLPLYVAIAALIGVPSIVAYMFLMPSTARLGIMDDGLILEAGSSKAPRSGVRQGYRWSDLRLDGARLVLPRVRPSMVSSFRLTAAQFERIAPHFGPG